MVKYGGSLICIKLYGCLGLLKVSDNQHFSYPHQLELVTIHTDMTTPYS